MSILATVLAQMAPPASAAAAPTFVAPAIAPSSQPEPQPAPPSGTTGPETPWYGAPAVAIDLGLVASFAIGVHYSKDYADTHGVDPWWAGPAVGLGLVAWATGSAFVHLANHRPDHARKSVLLRSGAFLAGAVIGVAILVTNPCNGNADTPNRFADYCYVGEATLIGLPLAATVFDDVWLAREPGLEPATARAKVAPSLLVRPGLALLGVGGTF
jgi:hypothetical protein